jgi:hypothetical protein
MIQPPRERNSSNEFKTFKSFKPLTGSKQKAASSEQSINPELLAAYGLQLAAC